ncbi:unnamed protein product, partial [Polarella glacialis]
MYAAGSEPDTDSASDQQVPVVPGSEPETDSASDQPAFSLPDQPVPLLSHWERPTPSVLLDTLLATRVVGAPTEFCFYVVWRVRGAFHDLRGFWVTRGVLGWCLLLERLPGKRYDPAITSLWQVKKGVGEIAAKGLVVKCGALCVVAAPLAVGPPDMMTMTVAGCEMTFQKDALAEGSDALRPVIPKAPAVPLRLPPPPPVPSGLAGLLGGLQGLYPQNCGPPDGEGGSNEEEEESSEEECARSKADRPKKKGNPTKNPAPSGKSPLDGFLQPGIQNGTFILQDVLLAKIIQDMEAPQGKKDRKDKGKGLDDSESGSDSDLNGVLLRQGMSSMKNISRLKREIYKQPKRVLQKFESMVIDEMGVSIGEAWSFRKWARRVQWGKFRGLRRCMEILIAIQERLKLGLPEVARAQTIQREMSAIAAYLGAISDLKKKIKGGNTCTDPSSGSGSEAEAELTCAAGEDAAAKKPSALNNKEALWGRLIFENLNELFSSRRSFQGQFPRVHGVGGPKQAASAVCQPACDTGPTPFLTPEQLEIRNNMCQFLREREEWEDAPIPCHKVPDHLEHDMAARLLEAKMGVLVESELLLKTPAGRIPVGGLFGVPKSGGRLRLIFDRRPQISPSVRVEWSWLPAVAQLGRGVLREGKVRTVVILVVNIAFAFVSLGWVICVNIDDLLVTSQVERERAHEPGHDHVLLARAEKAYADAGFLRAVDKDFRAQLDFKAWGAEARGGLGLSGGPMSVRRERWALTRGGEFRGLLQTNLGSGDATALHGPLRPLDRSCSEIDQLVEALSWQGRRSSFKLRHILRGVIPYYLVGTLDFRCFLPNLDAGGPLRPKGLPEGMATPVDAWGAGVSRGSLVFPSLHRSHPDGAKVLPCRATGIAQYLGGLLVIIAHAAGGYSGQPALLQPYDLFTSVRTLPLRSKTGFHLRAFDGTLGYPGEGPRDLQIGLDEVRQLDHTILTDTGPMGGLQAIRRSDNVRSELRGVSQVLDTCQQDMYDEFWEGLSTYPSVLRGYIPLFSYYTDSAYPSREPGSADEQLRLALKYEVGSLTRSLNSFDLGIEKRSIRDVEKAFAEMSLSYDRYLKAGNLYAGYDPVTSTTVFYEGIEDSRLVYTPLSLEQPRIRDEVLVIQGPDKGKVGQVIWLGKQGPDFDDPGKITTATVKLSPNPILSGGTGPGIREVKAYPYSWIAVTRTSEQSFTLDLLLGSSAAIFSCALTYPLDSLKSRIQAKLPLLPPEGIGGLFNGLSINLLKEVPNMGLYMACFNSLTRQFCLLPFVDANNPSLKLLVMIPAGVLGFLSGSFIRAPFELLNRKIQTGEAASEEDAIQQVFFKPSRDQ